MIKIHRLILVPFILASTTIYSQESGSKAGNGVSTDSDVIDIVATGIGSTQDAALENAFQNAVESALGLYVDAHTKVENEQVLQDEILTHSNGYIERFEKIREKVRDDGLYETRINAHVRKSQIIDKLKSFNVITTQVDTTSLYAKIVTQNQATEDAKTILATALKELNYPVSILKARIAATEPKLLGKGEQSVTVEWPIEISIDEKVYFEKIVPSLKQVLGQIAVKQSSIDIIRNAEKFPLGLGNDVTGYERAFLVERLREERMTDDIIGKPGIISVVTRKNTTGDNMSVWWCTLNSECYDILISLWSTEGGGIKRQNVPKLRISWLNNEGSAIIEDDISITDFSGVNGTEVNYGCTQGFGMDSRRGLRVGPFIYLERCDGCFGTTFRFAYPKQLSLQDLEQVVQMKCSFVVPQN